MTIQAQANALITLATELKNAPVNAKGQINSIRMNSMVNRCVKALQASGETLADARQMARQVWGKYDPKGAEAFDKFNAECAA